jgi:hypothetical protein
MGQSRNKKAPSNAALNAASESEDTTTYTKEDCGCRVGVSEDGTTKRWVAAECRLDPDSEHSSAPAGATVLGSYDTKKDGLVLVYKGGEP